MAGMARQVKVAFGNNMSLKELDTGFSALVVDDCSVPGVSRGNQVSLSLFQTKKKSASVLSIDRQC